MFLQALLEIGPDLHRGHGYTGVAKSGGGKFLFRIGDQIERFRAAKLGRRRPPVSLVVEGFPVFVADRLEAVKWKNWKVVRVRQARLLAAEVPLAEMSGAVTGAGE